MTRAYVSLGGNVGGPEVIVDRMQHAIHMVNGVVGVVVAAASPVYDTAPVGPVSEQPQFLNAVVALGLDDRMTAVELLACLLRIEARLGRDREGAVFQGPRPIDLDLLLVGNQRVEDPGPPPLVLPHPRMHERAFVLRPLADLAGPNLIVPGARTSIGSLLANSAVAAQKVTRSQLELTAPD